MTKARSAIECGNVKRPDNSGIYTRHAVPGAPPASVASGRLLIPRPSVCCASFLGAHEESVKIKEWKGKKKKKNNSDVCSVTHNDTKTLNRLRRKRGKQPHGKPKTNRYLATKSIILPDITLLLALH